MNKEHWSKLSFCEQMANIGSEYSRLVASKNSDLRQQSLYRLLELLDLTIADSRFQSRLKELVRLREIVCDQSQSKVLQAYFLPFAYAARK